jgi:hypothetical protein
LNTNGRLLDLVTVSEPICCDVGRIVVAGRPEDDQLIIRTLRVWLTYFVVASMLLTGAISTLSLETCNRMLVAWNGLE